jgi:hypothetical protein
MEFEARKATANHHLFFTSEVVVAIGDDTIERGLGNVASILLLRTL